ncbi:MAG: hypothetical protein ACRBBQ_04320 [Cognatishimia sp.]
MTGPSESVKNVESVESPFTHGFDIRLTIHEELECIEADISSFYFHNAEVVHRFYDNIEAHIAKTGHNKWFFLINYSRCHITPKAWPAFALRGKRLNLAHSQGTVRFDATPEMRLEIESRAQSENFDANLLADRDAALKRVAELPSSRRAVAPSVVRTVDVALFERRLQFKPEELILELDHSELKFQEAADVDAYFGYVEQQIKATDRRWFFLICNTGCEVAQPAWVRWAFRLRRLIKGAALGAVHYGLTSEQREDLNRMTVQDGLRNIICDSRDDATLKLASMLDEF